MDVENDLRTTSSLPLLNTYSNLLSLVEMQLVAAADDTRSGYHFDLESFLDC